MIRNQSFSRWAVATVVGALQMAALVSVSGQVNPPLPAQPLVRGLIVTEGEQALARARAAMKSQNLAQAYREYRSALKLTPPTGPLHDEALRGFSESGVKLAQQRLKEGRAAETDRIAREVLSLNPNYRPALDLLAPPSASTVKKEVPLVRSTPPADKESQSLTVPQGPTRKKRGGPRSQPVDDAVRKQQPETKSDVPEERPPEEEPPPPPPPPQRQQQQQQQQQATAPPTANVKQPLVRVFFATDRLPTGDGGPSNYFGKERNKTGEDRLVTGTVTVSIPPVHNEGKVERPFKWWIIEFKEDPKKHFVLTELKVKKSDDFYGALREEYDRRDTDKRSAFVYIHGFNVSFDEAAFNTAQLTYDLDFEGVPIMYSWPSQGSILNYQGDVETTDWSAVHLTTFLERVARESGALRIHILAHSMGNRLLTAALSRLKRQPDIQPLFDNVIMAAPDVNADTFTEQIWPEIKTAAKRFTLYASSSDKALIASKEAKGASDFDRLGEAGPKIVVIPGLDTVDASGIDTSLLGHSYVDSCKPVMVDLQLLISKAWTPGERKLRGRQKEGLAYWAFP